MSTYLLIVVLNIPFALPMNLGEFRTKAACEAAAHIVRKDVPDVRTRCYPTYIKEHE